MDGGGSWDIWGGMVVVDGVGERGIVWVCGEGGPGEGGGIGGFESAGAGVGSRGVDVDGAGG